MEGGAMAALVVVAIAAIGMWSVWACVCWGESGRTGGGRAGEECRIGAGQREAEERIEKRATCVIFLASWMLSFCLGFFGNVENFTVFYRKLPRELSADDVPYLSKTVQTNE